MIADVLQTGSKRVCLLQRQAVTTKGCRQKRRNTTEARALKTGNETSKENVNVTKIRETVLRKGREGSTMEGTGADLTYDAENLLRRQRTTTQNGAGPLMREMVYRL